MSGIKTSLLDLGKIGQKAINAIRAEDARKREMINEFRFNFMKKGFAPWQATSLAEEKYREIHKNDR